MILPAHFKRGLRNANNRKEVKKSNKVMKTKILMLAGTNFPLDWG
jgi:hypothetical protein